jgi:SARP family transcriptional regulator, regulator of embCAB operon
MNIRCLGVFTIESDHQVYVPRPSGRARLLAWLVLHSGAVVPAASLMTEMWGSSLGDNAKNALHAQIVRLRRDLRTWTSGSDLRIRTQFPGYALDLGNYALDVSEFRALLERFRVLRRGNPGESVRLARLALGLWRGDAFTGLPLGPAGEAMKVGLNQARFSLLLDATDVRLDVGDHAALVPELQELVQLHPYCETLYAQLMTALYRAGRLAEAVQAYKAAYELFARELGVDPSPALGRLLTRMLSHDPALWQAAAQNGAYLADRLVILWGAEQEPLAPATIVAQRSCPTMQCDDEADAGATRIW